jgi:hypothetical protein
VVFASATPFNSFHSALNMENLRHRTAPNNRYALRRRGHQAPVIITNQRTATQQGIDAAARGIKKSWRIPRASKRSRGLRRTGNKCFLLSAMQTLVHLPGFDNWILSHNSISRGTVKFPCQSIAEISRALDLRPKKSQDKLQQCPACVVKRFVIDYWGHDDPQHIGAPLAFPHNHPRMVAIRNLDGQIKSFTPDAGDDDDDEQQDSTEFQDRLLQACLASTDHT